MSKLLGLVDDEKVFHWIVEKYVSKLDGDVKFMSFFDGDEIYDYLTNSPDVVPDVLFLDLNMPVCNGWKFLDDYTANGGKPGLDIYVLSSSIDPRDLKKAESYPLVKDFITKPITEEILLKVLK